MLHVIWTMQAALFLIQYCMQPTKDIDQAHLQMIVMLPVVQIVSVLSGDGMILEIDATCIELTIDLTVDGLLGQDIAELIMIKNDFILFWNMTFVN